MRGNAGFPESIPHQIFPADGHLVELVLILRQFANHGPEQRRIMDGRRTNVKHGQAENSSVAAQCRTGVASVPTHTQLPRLNSQVSTKRSRRV
jgi:hypothetical protein